MTDNPFSVLREAVLLHGAKVTPVLSSVGRNADGCEWTEILLTWGPLFTASGGSDRHELAVVTVREGSLIEHFHFWDALADRLSDPLRHGPLAMTDNPFAAIAERALEGYRILAYGPYSTSDRQGDRPTYALRLCTDPASDVELVVMTSRDHQFVLEQAGLWEDIARAFSDPLFLLAYLA